MAVNVPNCLKCKHYYVTYDPARPFGCRAMKFKSATSPARVVFKTSGLHCQLYNPKKNK